MANQAPVGGFFNGVNAAKPRVDAQYLRPGSYTLRIVEVKALRTRTKRDAFIVECVVNSAVEGSENKPGDRVSHAIMMDTDGALSDIRAFAAAATGFDFDEVDEAGLEQLVSPAQPLTGRIIEATARNKPTKSGGDFTRITYSPVAGTPRLGESAAAPAVEPAPAKGAKAKR